MIHSATGDRVQITGNERVASNYYLILYFIQHQVSRIVLIYTDNQQLTGDNRLFVSCLEITYVQNKSASLY